MPAQTGPLPAISFEFFPAKSEKAAATLLENAKTLAAFGPQFMSVTYGAGGSTRERTLATLKDMVRETGAPMAGHLTCVGASREDVNAVARAYWDAGVKHIVALRGDPPPSAGGVYEPHPEGYAGAVDLVRGLKEIAPFEISVAAYPETHPAALSPQADLEHLRAKIDAGADRALTQFFFEADTFLRFLDRAAAIGIERPIVPGILPVGSAAQAWKFADMCGASVPTWMRDLFEGLDETPQTRAFVAATIADRLCQTLKAEGVEQFHFYTLNHADTASALCRLLGRRPI